MNWNLYRLERIGLIKEGIPASQATEQAYLSVKGQEAKERAIIGEELLSPKNN